MDTGDRPAAGKRVRTYGPEHYLVDVACGSDYVRGTLDILESCIMNSAGHVLLHGDYGSGKSRMLEAAIAMCEERSVAVQVLFPDETQPEALLKSVQSDEPVCAFEIDDSLSSGIRKELLERVREHRACAIGTVSALSKAEELTLERDGWNLRRLPDPQDDVEHSIAVAEVMWLQESRSDNTMRSAFVEEAIEGVGMGPWESRFHSMRAFFGKLCDALVLRGVLAEGELLGKVETADVNEIVLDVLRLEQPARPATNRGLCVVTEGDTDVGYLLKAAELANQEWGSRLLEGCEVEPGGEGDKGGGTAAVRKLAARSFTHDAIGLFDNDEPGRTAKKHASSLNLKALCLPEALDPLQRPQGISLEIEDLLPADMIVAFYRSHEDCVPEGSNERGGVKRLVPEGKHKGMLMRYACSKADYSAFEKLVYVVCLLWNGLGLPLPEGPASNMKTWLRALKPQ